MQDETNTPKGPVERAVRLTMTEDEYKTMMTALHDYGHYCLGASDELARVSIQREYESGVDYLEGSRLAKKCGDRAFELKRRIKDLWET